MQKTMALYGAGRKSLAAELRLRRHFFDWDARWLVENRDFSKLGQSIPRLDGAGEPLEVVSLAGLKRLRESGACQRILIPGGYHLFDLREARNFAAKAGFAPEDIHIMPHNCLAGPVDRQWKPEEVSAEFDKHPFIYLLDVHVIDNCNLKCKACAHFSSLVDNEVIYTVEEIASSLSRLAQLAPNIMNLRLLGGEPLLHPGLADMVRIARSAFPYAEIGVTTNGLLLKAMPEELVLALRECNVGITLSLYPSLQAHIDEMTGILRKHGLSWHVQRCDSFEKRLFSSPVAEPERGFNKCGHNMCLRGDRLGYCVMALFTDYFNARFGPMLPEDKGVDIFAVNSGPELMAALVRPLDLCARCVSRDAGLRYSEPWQPAGSDPSPSDWFIDNEKERII